MSTTYTKADRETMAFVRATMKKHHDDLHQHEVSVDVVFAENEDGDAVKLHGYPCFAVVKIIPYKRRVKGEADAEITIDREQWNDADEDAREALIDHELTHLTVVKKDGAALYDRHGRPKLRMRLHDKQVGIFLEVIERHGEAAQDTKLVRGLTTACAQLHLFEMAGSR
jgi:hypothetical protein